MCYSPFGTTVEYKSEIVPKISVDLTIDRNLVESFPSSVN